MSSVGPLYGFTIAVTAERRRHEFGAALEARGARVFHAQAMRIVEPAQDVRLRAATEHALQHPADILVATTAAGITAWLSAVQDWGLAELVHQRLESAVCLARGPDGAHAMLAAGRPAWAPERDSAEALLARLRKAGVAGRRIWLQTHGSAGANLLRQLTRERARVVDLPTFGWTRPPDEGPVRQLTAEVVAGHVDAVAFTSPAAVAAFLDIAQDDGRATDVLHCLRTNVAAACIGPVTAAGLRQLGVPVIMPRRPRLAALVREITQRVPAQQGLVLYAAGHRLAVRGHAAVLDGTAVPVSPEAMTILRLLATRHGDAVATTEIAAVLEAGGHRSNPHAEGSDPTVARPASAPGVVSGGAVSGGAVSGGAVSGGAVSGGAGSDGAASGGAVSGGAASDGAALDAAAEPDPDAAVARLRAALGDSRIIEQSAEGYRIAVVQTASQFG